MADTEAALGAIHALLAPGGRIALLDLEARTAVEIERDGRTSPLFLLTGTRR